MQLDPDLVRELQEESAKDKATLALPREYVCMGVFEDTEYFPEDILP